MKMFLDSFRTVILDVSLKIPITLAWLIKSSGYKCLAFAFTKLSALDKSISKLIHDDDAALNSGQYMTCSLGNMNRFLDVEIDMEDNLVLLQMSLTVDERFSIMVIKFCFDTKLFKIVFA